MTRQIRLGVVIVIAASVAGFVAVSTVFAPGTIPADEALTSLDDSGAAPGSASMRAYLDPETGELTVGPAPGADMPLDPDTQNALRRDSEGLVQKHHADGSVSMDLQGRYQSISVVHIDDDGKVVVCTDSDAGVTNALAGRTTGKNKPEVK